MNNKSQEYLFCDSFFDNYNILTEDIKKAIRKLNLENSKEELLVELKGICIDYLKAKANNLKNKNRINEIDNKKEKIKLKEFINDSIIGKLPDWVKEKLDEAFILGKSGKVIAVKGKKYHMDNPLNDLDGGEWTFFLRSVINTRYPVSGQEGFAHHIRKIHPTPKPPQLMRDIIRFFTKKEEWVLDYFMGVGGTLLGASLCDRKAIGIDLNIKYIDAYKKATEDLTLKKQITICGDAIEVLASKEIGNILQDEKVSLICIDPPYGDMMSRKKTGENAKKKKSTDATPFTELDHDLGNVDKKTFLILLKQSAELAIKYLRNKRYMIIFTKDFQPSGKNSNLLHAEIIDYLNKIEGLNYVGMKIWVDESINLYPYGYPYAFVPNQLHQYILIFRKEIT